MYRAVFAAALALFGFVLLPILAAETFYIDDLGRSLHGYLGWGRDARPLANVVMEVLNLGTPLVDLSPLPQIGAALLFAGLAVTVARRFGFTGVWRAPLALLPLFASPFFLENLSYRFDALTMSLAVCVAAWSAMLPLTPRWRIVAAGLGLLASLSLYQPAAAVFLIFALLQYVAGQINQDVPGRIVRVLVWRIALWLATLALYALTIARTVKGNYGLHHAGMESGWPMVGVVADNLEMSVRFVVQSLRTAGGAGQLAAIVFALLAMTVAGVAYARRQWRGSAGWQRGFLLLGVVGIPAAAFIGMWGPLLLLRHPVMVPRTQIGAGALAAAGAILLTIVMEKRRWGRRWQVAVLAVLAYPLIAFAMVYGNTLRLQQVEESRISASLADDLAMLAADGQAERWALHGQAAMPPVGRHNADRYPFLKRLVPLHLSQGWGWATDRLAHAGLQLPRAANDSVDLAGVQACRTRAAIVRQSYRIYLVEGTAVVIFKDVPMPACPAGPPG